MEKLFRRNAFGKSGESRKDFIHKIKVVLKELRETFVCLKIIQRAKLYKSEKKIQTSLKENNELISIFVKSVATAQRNIDNEIKNRKSLILALRSKTFQSYRTMRLRL